LEKPALSLGVLAEPYSFSRRGSSGTQTPTTKISMRSYKVFRLVKGVDNMYLRRDHDRDKFPPNLDSESRTYCRRRSSSDKRLVCNINMHGRHIAYNPGWSGDFQASCTAVVVRPFV
jgi:hypothetical protein